LTFSFFGLRASRLDLTCPLAIAGLPRPLDMLGMSGALPRD